MDSITLVKKWRDEFYRICRREGGTGRLAEHVANVYRVCADELEATLAAQPASPKDDLRDLRDIPDSEIDTSDIPEVKDWSNAERGKFYRASPVAVNAPQEGMTFEEWFDGHVWLVGNPEFNTIKLMAERAWQACLRTHADALTPMKCGHPKACRKTEYHCEGTRPFGPDKCVPDGHNHSFCTRCVELADREKAVEAAALQLAGSTFREAYRLEMLDSHDREMATGQGLRAIDNLITPDRQSALDEALKLKERGVIEHVKGGWHDGCQCEPCVFVRNLVAEEVRNAK